MRYFIAALLFFSPFTCKISEAQELRIFAGFDVYNERVVCVPGHCTEDDLFFLDITYKPVDYLAMKYIHLSDYSTTEDRLGIVNAVFVGIDISWDF